jgi:hypothetical protein
MVLTALAPEYLTIGPIPSGGSFVYAGIMTQRDRVTPIASGMLLSLSLTLTDVATGAVINSRDVENVFNQNGVSVDNSLGTGALQWIGAPADNPFVRVAPPPALGDVERHEATFQWTWTELGVTYAGKKKVFIVVESYQNQDVPTIGSGSRVATDFVYEPDGVTPVDDALVWATSDPAGNTLVAGPVQTTALGQWTMLLNPGTYYLWARSPAFALSGPNTLTVT